DLVLHSTPTRRSSDLLGTDGYGTYGLAMSVIALLMIPTEFGLPILVVRETAASVAGREWAKFRGLLRWSARFIIGTSLLVSLVRSEEHTSELQSRENL